jgi:phosphoglycerol transferase MdoB-like AlkP superfamily enzyme
LAIVKIYVTFVALFVLQKPLFMLCNATMYSGVGWTEWLSVIWHGLPLDLSVAGYLTAIPALFMMVSAWVSVKRLHRIATVYNIVVAVLLSLIVVVDVTLYGYWGFRLDTTPLFYFLSSPRDAMASVGAWEAVGGIALTAIIALLIYLILRALQKNIERSLKQPYKRVAVSVVVLLFAALLFIPIRGGFSVSTMNVGKVYFSGNMHLNHAAINPAFSLLESFSKQSDFSKQYRFMDNAAANDIMKGLSDPAVISTDPAATPATPADTLFTAKRPNIIFIIMESFSAHLMTSLGGEPDIAVNLDSLATRGVLFTNFYANSFRTDRGLVSILSGYPAQPTTSIMKYPHKTQRLPSVAGVLSREGYRTGYYYGGDADFTNMRSYLISSGFEHIVCDSDFPVRLRLSKWGVHDEYVFERLLSDLRNEAEGEVSAQPFFRVLQTSSSHEPFEVPYRRLTDDKQNAFAYTDHCIGEFVREFSRLPQWENTVLVLVPDHQGGYPEHLDNLSPERYHIPLILTGGAIRAPRHIDVYGSQQDIAATLLAQLGLPHGEFTFSKDMLNPVAPHFAFFTIPDAFGMADRNNTLIYDCASGITAFDQGASPGANLLKGKAYLQELYNDLDSL